MVFWHHLYQILSLKKPNAKHKQEKTICSINHLYLTLCFQQKGIILGETESCFQTLQRSVDCYHSDSHLSVIWLRISCLFLQRLPRLGCIAAQTPNLLRRLWPRWNASTNTQTLPLSHSHCHTHSLFFFCLKLSLSLALRHEHILPPCLTSPLPENENLLTLQLKYITGLILSSFNNR